MTPPLPEMVESAAGAELAAEELSAAAVELLEAGGELLRVEAELLLLMEDAAEDTADELVAEDVVVGVEAAVAELAALEVVVMAAGSGLPQPVRARVAAAVAAMNTDRDVLLRSMAGA